MTVADEYINAASDEPQQVLRKLHRLIRKTAPEYEPYIQKSGSKKILGYGKTPYETKSGSTGEWFKIGLATWKTGVSVYVLAVKDGAYLAERYADKLDAKVGKSCIRFTNLDRIDYDVLEELFREAVDT